MKAVIFAAGLGTRLRPLTNEKPKALVKIGEKTFLELAIHYLQKFGINEFVINIHHFGQRILDYLDKMNSFGAKIHISDERNQLLDTGGGLKAMEKWLKDGPFVIYNVDVITEINLEKMMEFHQQTNALATLAVSDRKTSRYLQFDEDHQLVGWKNVITGEVKNITAEKVISKSLAFSGIHIINPTLFQYKPKETVFSIVDWYLALAKNHKISGYDHSGIFWLDAGKLPALKEARRHLGNF